MKNIFIASYCVLAVWLFVVRRIERTIYSLYFAKMSASSITCAPPTLMNHETTAVGRQPTPQEGWEFNPEYSQNASTVIASGNCRNKQFSDCQHSGSPSWPHIKEKMRWSRDVLVTHYRQFYYELEIKWVKRPHFSPLCKELAWLRIAISYYTK